MARETRTRSEGRARRSGDGGAKVRTAPAKSSIWTPANIVTVARVVLVPIWLLIAEFAKPSFSDKFSFSLLVVAILFIAISLTDKLDGHLARTRNEITTFGKFLDPIADKLVVIVALAYLLETGVISVWVLFVVVLREFLVSGLRMVVASEGVVIAASNLGKAKTAFTMVALSGLLFVMCLPAGSVTSVLGMVFRVILWVAVALTAYSGVDYFIKSWPYLSK